MLSENQRTNGPVNAHLTSGPGISTISSLTKFDLVVNRLRSTEGLSFT